MVVADGEVDALLQLVGISECLQGVQGVAELYHGQLAGDTQQSQQHTMGQLLLLTHTKLCKGAGRSQAE